MGLMDIVALPLRVTLGLAQLASPSGPLRRKGGYADQFSTGFGEGGLAEQLMKVISDPAGPVSLVSHLTALTSEERPLGKAIAPGGALDRLLAEDGALERLLSADGLLDRLLAEGGALDRITQQEGVLEQLFSRGGPLDRLLSEGGALDRITQEGGVLELLLREQGLADRLLAEDGFVEKLTAEGGTLDQLLKLGDILNDLQESVLVLNRAVGPLGDLANRVPSSLLRRRGGESTGHPREISPS
jgi:hypothetical protein